MCLGCIQGTLERLVQIALELLRALDMALVELSQVKWVITKSVSISGLVKCGICCESHVPILRCPDRRLGVWPCSWLPGPQCLRSSQPCCSEARKPVLSGCCDNSNGVYYSIHSIPAGRTLTPWYMHHDTCWHWRRWTCSTSGSASAGVPCLKLCRFTCETMPFTSLRAAYYQRHAISRVQ